MDKIRELKIPGDKSISHRAIMLSALGRTKVLVENILLSEDILMTINCFRDMGVKIEIDEEKNQALVYGVGLYGLKEPARPLYCGNSGTTMRLMAGILVNQKFDSILTGDESLNRRPMDRIIRPLRQMGAGISSKSGIGAPLYIEGNRKLHSIDYEMEIDSAQVKSAILLASLYQEEDSIVREKNKSRDHTERMITYFRQRDFKVQRLVVPGDISSAAYFIVDGLINKREGLLIRQLGINKTRTGMLELLLSIGGDIALLNRKVLNNEEVADLYVEYSKLKAFTIDERLIARLIDEIPILAVLAAFIEGESSVSAAGELRVKETDRIRAICSNLRSFGADITEYDDGFSIRGGKKLRPAVVDSFKDHRIYMAFSILAKKIGDGSRVLGGEVSAVSFPGFQEELSRL